MNKKYDKKEILLAINNLLLMHKACRAQFPNLKAHHLGEQIIKPPIFYKDVTFIDYVKLKDSIDEESFHRINSIGHFLNQNVIIRLHSILNYYRIIGDEISIDQTIAGWKEIDLTRRLRNVFSHSKGTFNPNSKDHVFLAKRIVEDYKLKVKNKEPKGFLIPIDELLVPLFDGCRRYVMEKEG